MNVIDREERGRQTWKDMSPWRQRWKERGREKDRRIYRETKRDTFVYLEWS